MTKEEFAAYLTEKGYPAENENGIVMVSKEKPLTKDEVKTIKNIMHEAGYNASYGYSCFRDEGKRH